MADGNSKKQRNAKRGRARGSEIKTGHGGGGKTKLSTLEKALIHPSYLERLGDSRGRRIERERAGAKKQAR